jgi:hypothetical protein
MSVNPPEEKEGKLAYVDTETETEVKQTKYHEGNVIESNVLCSLFVCVCGVVLDALYALPGELLDDVPASLRTTSIVLCVILGAPPITKGSTFVLEQRAIAAVLLSIAAFVGLNRAETTARNSDAVFSLVAVLACAVACSTNGAHTQDEANHRKKLVREHLTAFVAALLFYLGMRTVRHAFALPNEVQGFTVSLDDIQTRGYGVASEIITSANAFSGAITVSFAVITLLNFDLNLHTGSTSVSTIGGTLASFVFASSFVAQLSMFSLFSHLPALFGENACDGTFKDCEAAFRARRLFLCSNTPVVPWVCAITMTTFAFSERRRFENRGQHYNHSPDIYSVPYAGVLISAFVAACTILFFVDVNSGMNWSDVELMLLVISIPFVLFHFPILGTLTHLSGQTVYIATRYTSEIGYSWTYFTHHSLFASTVILLLIAILSFVSFSLYTFRDLRMYSEPVEMATAILSTVLLSVQTFLTLATLGMASGFTGALYRDGKGSWNITGYEYSVQHSVSFFFSAALYAVRYEHRSLKLWQTRAAWLALPPIMGIAWWVCVLVLTTTQHDPYTTFVDVGSFLIGVSAAGVAWLGVGLCLNI